MLKQRVITAIVLLALLLPALFAGLAHGLAPVVGELDGAVTYFVPSERHGAGVWGRGGGLAIAARAVFRRAIGGGSG